MSSDPIQAGSRSYIAERPPPRRKLMLAVDGVPWQAIDEIRKAGRFRLFNNPSRVISPFPTMTNVGMRAMLGLKRPLGYENLYFDRQRGRMSGGPAKYVKSRTREPDDRGYNHLMEYQEPMQFEFLVYVAPDRVFSADLSRLLNAFKKSDSAIFNAFLKSTDGLVHVGGREKLAAALSQLDDELTELYEQHSGQLEITMYSDHGNAMIPFKRVSLKTHVSGFGFAPSKRITGRRSVIIPGFGLCSYAPVFCAPGNRRELAESIAMLPGVDFTVFQPEEDPAPGAVTELIGAKGRARIHYDELTNAFRYEQLSGDPLALADRIAALEADSLLDRRGYVPDRAWFDATMDHLYPDGVRNIWASVRDHVESTADLLVSFEDGYGYGAAVFERIVTLAASHGSALRSTSYAFMMSTHRKTPDCLRAQDAVPWLRGPL